MTNATRGSKAKSGQRAWLKRGGLLPEAVRVIGRAMHVTLSREHVDALRTREG